MKKEKHGWFYKLIKFVFGIFGYHISRNPPTGAKRKTKLEESAEGIGE